MSIRKYVIAFVAIAFVSLNAFSKSDSLAPMLKKVMPAVVNISVIGEHKDVHFYVDRYRRDFKLSPKFAVAGSGVIVNAKKGYILTNAHVVKDAKVISVTLKDKRKFQGKLVGLDEESDIAVIQINAKNLKAIHLGNSNKLKIGDTVTAIGNPFGIGQTVTSGIISNLHVTGLGLENYEDFIQTDAPINPGNSGGALVNSKGQLIGMNTAILTSNSVEANVGIGFAIPSNMCKKVMDQIIKYKNVKHSLVGVIMQNITPELTEALKLPNTNGALVTEVLPDLPAAKAGVKVEDVIEKVNNEPVSTSSQIKNIIGLLRPKTKISVEIYRNHKMINLSLTTESAKEAKEEEEKDNKSILKGLYLSNFNQLEDNEQITGVQILQI